MKLSPPEVHALFDRKLQEMCALSVSDAGLDTDEIDHMLEGVETEPQVKRAVLDYADDRGLDVRGRDWC